MKSRWLWIPLILCGLCSNPAVADNHRIIVRTTLGLQGLQAFCLLQNCTVVCGLDGSLNQLFLITTPVDVTTFLNLLSTTPGIVDAEADQLLSLDGLNQVTTPPPGLSDTTPVQSARSFRTATSTNRRRRSFTFLRPRLPFRLRAGEL